MWKYDKSKNLLTLYKVKNPEMGERFDCLRDVKESFYKFEKVSALETLELINEIMNEDWEVPDKFRFRVSKEPGYGVDVVHTVIWGQVPGRPEIRIIKLPCMDNLGKLHFAGSGDRVKVIVNKLVASNDISWDENKRCLSLVLNKRTVRITRTATNITIEGTGGRTAPLPRIIDFVQSKMKAGIDLREYIRNPILQEGMVGVTGNPLFFAIKQEDADTGLITNLTENPDYSCAKVRSSLNAAVSIDRAIGERLSRPVLNYPEGTYVTPAVIEDVKRAKINCIYVRTLQPAPKKRITGGIGVGMEEVMVMSVPAGTRVTPYLRNYLEREEPELADYDILPRAIRTATQEFAFKGVYATQEVLEFLESVGYEGVLLGNKRVPYYFETEILGNYTFRESDIMENGDPDKWVYIRDGVQSPYNEDRLSPYDLMALYSTIGFMVLRDRSIFMDKDRDFLKNVDMSNELMTRALSKAIRSHMNQFRQHIKMYVQGVAGKEGIFSQLGDTFLRQLNEDGSIDTCDTTNFIAEISQATHVSKKVAEAPETMRHIAVPYYGRICPFETPEGKQIGLVNNKALSCHIVDGEMLMVVRRVHAHGDTITIADEMEELSVRDAVNYRVSDMLSLTPISDGVYANTRIPAIVPNPEPFGDRLIYAKVMASDLDYVAAHTDGFISATVSMIPFAAANDAVRVSFGSKMIKAAIYLLDPDVPCVRTHMYEDIFLSSDAYLLRAKNSGTVTDIATDTISVLYDGDTDETVHGVTEFKVTKDSVVLMRYKVSVGDRVRKGQILADTSFTHDGVYCPGKNELVAYMSTGYNYEDAIHVCDRASIDFISLGATEIRRNKDDTSTLSTDGMCKYYTRGELVTTITKRNKYGDVQSVPVYAEHGSGIWYEKKTAIHNGKRVYKLSLLGYNRLQNGDKMSGRHGNKGVSARVSPNSEMPMLANGMPIRVLLNPHGVPSRMNLGQILETHLGLVATVLGVNMNSDAMSGATTAEVGMLMRMTWELANTNNPNNCRAIMSSYGMPSDMIERVEQNMSSVMEWAGTFDQNGDAQLFNPVTGKWFPYKVTIGVSTMLKMKQEAETKIHTRGGLLEETYRVTTGQPPKGGEGGGQAMGEMELTALAAYGASNLLYEVTHVKSDDEVARCNSELEAAGSNLRVPDKYSVPRAVTNVLYSLEAFGLALESDAGELPDVSLGVSRDRYVYRVKDLLTRAEELETYEEREEESSRTEKLVDDVLTSLFG